MWVLVTRLLDKKQNITLNLYQPEKNITLNLTKKIILNYFIEIKSITVEKKKIKNSWVTVYVLLFAPRVPRGKYILIFPLATSFQTLSHVKYKYKQASFSPKKTSLSSSSFYTKYKQASCCFRSVSILV